MRRIPRKGAENDLANLRGASTLVNPAVVKDLISNKV